jgi:hypothetical protein
VAEAVFEGPIVTVIAHLDETFFHAERVGEILACGVTLDFGGPALEVFAVEETYIALLSGDRTCG